MRVYLNATRLYAYPDISVVCGPRQFHAGRNDTITNPVVIVEVLSDATEAYDRGAKFRHYRTLPSLQSASLKGLLRRVVGKVFRVEIKGWCSEFEARDAAGRQAGAPAAG